MPPLRFKLSCHSVVCVLGFEMVIICCTRLLIRIKEKEESC